MTIDLVTTHQSEVVADQIDHLGHMNVRFYGVNAFAGTGALLGELGVEAPSAWLPVDMYTRHHREQLLGAQLVVRSGVIDAHTEEVRLYHELANRDTGALAATFVHRLAYRDKVGRDEAGHDLGASTALVAAASARRVTIPAHGATRSIELDTDPVTSAPSLDELRRRRLEMRKVRTVTAQECDETGAYIPAAAPMLTWGGESVSKKVPEMLHELPGGVRMGWASMETRMVIGRLPRFGDRIQSFSAVIGLHDKTSHRIQWAYDMERGDLLTTFEVVNLAFDVTARASMSIPARIRDAEQTALHNDLAPRRST